MVKSQDKSFLTVIDGNSGGLSKTPLCSALSTTLHRTSIACCCCCACTAKLSDTALRPSGGREDDSSSQHLSLDLTNSSALSKLSNSRQICQTEITS